MSTRWIERGARAAARLPRGTKASIALTADAFAIPLALLGAIALRRESISDALNLSAWLYVAATLSALATFAALGMYRAVFRFISDGALFKSTLGVLIACAMLTMFNLLAFNRDISLNAVVIFAVLALLYLVGSRAFVRELLNYTAGVKKRVAIYGAGATGAQLARSLRDSGHYTPVAFIDEDSALQGSVIAGIKVFSPRVLPALVKRKRISSVLLAMPSCSRRQRRSILKSLEPLPVHVRTVPEIGDIIAGHAKVEDLREVDSNDLLGREPVAPNIDLLEACIRQKNVMVTGAGGSIGSELCRQIMRSAPRRLLLLEISECALYQIERELRSLAQALRIDVEIVALLGNVHHRPRMRELIQAYSVQTLYHAAAYKHVPIVEHNMVEGIRNNVFGTLCLAEAAIESEVETFVLISTDKAVNPTNVMGASKRFAELVLQALQERTTVTRLCMVRFGNVLESSGSVVPLFREQIKRGGPVTVTHKDIIRYFMTIPEASQLVLQAGAMAQGGDVFVLDMGEPVRIIDLARRMINLMGATVRDENNPEGDIEIEFTGLRPAEKLYEELLIGKNVTGTEHPMIMRAKEHHVPWAQLEEVLLEILNALDEFNCLRARELLMRTVVEYQPASAIQDIVWLHSQKAELTRSKVTELRPHRMRVQRDSGPLPLAQ
jgi:FlaA1/EpsC-like NDP-sugar epimerase